MKEVGAKTTRTSAAPRAKPPANKPENSPANEVAAALKWLKSNSSKATLDGMSRYAIPSDKAYGVAMKDIKALGKEIGRNQRLAEALWDTDVYEGTYACFFCRRSR